jgi:hypothetical protein
MIKRKSKEGSDFNMSRANDFDIPKEKFESRVHRVGEDCFTEILSRRLILRFIKMPGTQVNHVLCSLVRRLSPFHQYTSVLSRCCGRRNTAVDQDECTAFKAGARVGVAKCWSNAFFGNHPLGFYSERVLSVCHDLSVPTSSNLQIHRKRQ